MAPTQSWLHFILTLEKKMQDIDDGIYPEKQQAAGSSGSDATDASSGQAQSSEPADSASDSSGIDIEELKTYYGDGKSIPDAPMIDYQKIKRRYHREDPLTEEDLADVSRIKYYAGKAHRSKYYHDSALSNALIVNKRKGKVFAANLVCEFKNQFLELPGVETRAACSVTLVHPLIGAMQIYSLHLDHVKEPRRIGQFEQLVATLRLPETSPFHIIMGDFNAITQSDYSEEYESEQITKVRREGQWEPPQYDLTEMIKALGYVDFWRRCNPDVKDQEVTTCAYNTRIDYIFISPKLAERIDWESENTYCHILNGVFHSDHFPVLANIQFKS